MKPDRPEMNVARFAALPSAAVIDVQLSHIAFRLLALIAALIDDDGYVDVAPAAAGQLLGCTAEDVDDMLETLEGAEFIRVRDRGDAEVAVWSVRLVFDRP